jgi:hypothetical protein
MAFVDDAVRRMPPAERPPERVAGGAPGPVETLEQAILMQNGLRWRPQTKYAAPHKNRLAVKLRRAAGTQSARYLAGLPR